MVFFRPESKTIHNSDIVPENKVVVGRHFEDVDDVTYNLDAPLKPLDKTSIKLLELNVQEIIRNTEAKKFHKILIISSPKKRAIQTSEIIKEFIQKAKHNFSVHIRRDNHFAELFQGKLVLPKNYQKGDKVKALTDAWSIFWKESFTETGDYNNPNYHFGDPILRDNVAKYPELINHFSSYGESYREQCLRYYQGVLSYFDNKKRLENANINIVLIGHGATIGILSGLLGVLNDIENGTRSIKVGDLMKVSRQKYLYQRRHKQYLHTPLGGLKLLSLNNLSDKSVALLKAEINYLKVPKHYGKKH